VIRMLFSLLLQVRVRLPPSGCKRLSVANPSPAKPAAIQKRLLLRRRHPAKHRVAVRKPAEVADDVGMKFGVFERARICGGSAQLQTSLLVGERFRVHEGKIEERPLRLGGLPVETAVDRAAGRGAGKRVGGKRGGTAAEHVARKL